MDNTILLVGDIGGTNARFALASVDAPAFSDTLTMPCAEFETAEMAIDAYLERVGVGQPVGICLAAAGPIIDNCIDLTNNHWTLDAGLLTSRYGAKAVRLVNDFEAISYSVPFLGNESLSSAGLVSSALDIESDFTVGVVGPGTGLGVGGLIGRSGRISPLVGEGGHVGFAPESQREVDVLMQLRKRYERVSVERLLSGPGIENIFWALRKIYGKPGANVSAADVFDRAVQGGDPIATEAVNVFFEALGHVAGNLALSMGAWDGVYIAGGIVKRYPELLKASGFRTAFESKGRHRALMETIPTQLITHAEPGLLGASYCAAQGFAQSMETGRSG